MTVAATSARVRFCSWCRAVTIFPGRADDHLSIFLAGDVRVATVNAEPLIIQDGICEECRRNKFPQREQEQQ